MACWARVGSTTTAQAFMSINTTSATDRHTLTMNATGNVLANTNVSSVDYSSTTTGALTANTWAHCAGVWSSSSNRVAYLNGTAATANTSNVTPTSLTTTLLAARRNTTVGLYLNGQLAECCIWSVALNDAEIASLAKGQRAIQVRPDSILAYWPLGGHFGELDADFSGNGYLLTANGAVGWSQNYPQIIFSPPIVPFAFTSSTTLSLDVIASGTTVEQPTITPGSVSIVVPEIAATTTVYEPTIAATFPLALDNIAATTTVNGPTLTPGAVSISAPLIAATTTVYEPQVAAAGLSINLDIIGPNTTVYEPTLTPGPVSVTLDVISATTTVYQPNVASGATTIALDAIAATTQVYQPDIYNTLQQLALSVIAPTTQVYGPVVGTTSNDTSDILKRRKRTRKEIEEENIAVQLLTKQRAETLEEPGSRKQIKIDLKTQQNVL